jgi:hypothetical protein
MDDEAAMHWNVAVEATMPAGLPPDFEETAGRSLKRFGGTVQVDGQYLRVSFSLESPSVKRAARAAFVIFGRIAGQNEPSRFGLIRLDPAEAEPSG